MGENGAGKSTLMKIVCACRIAIAASFTSEASQPLPCTWRCVPPPASRGPEAAGCSEVKLAAIAILHAAHDLHQRRFACAILAHQEMDFAGVDH